MRTPDLGISTRHSSRAGAVIVGLLVCLPTFPDSVSRAADARISLQCNQETVGKYQKLEFQIRVSGSHTNAFDPDEVEVNLQVTAPNGESLTIPAFFSQDYERRRPGSAGLGRDWLYPVGLPGWKARFAPSRTGNYQARVTLKDREGVFTSNPVRFVCGGSPSKGFVRVSRGDPRHLEFSEGQAFFPIGQNLAFIGSQQYVTLSKAEEIFRKLSAHGANYLRLWTCCEDWAMALEARKSAWGRSWDWRPPIVSSSQGDGGGRKYLKLSPQRATLGVNPSHPVALRPGTRYVVSGRVKTEHGASLSVEINRAKPDQPIASPAGAWTPFSIAFETGPDEFWLAAPALRLQGGGEVYLADLSLREAGGGPELLWEAEINRPVRGFYNPLDCFMLDELVTAAERNGLQLQLCLLTRDLYMEALKDPAAPEYASAIKDARKLFRYAIARWGYSTSVAAWEYWNEMNPGLPTDAFYTALGDYLEKSDPYRHLRTTSTWGPSARDCRHSKLDIADTHFYLRPADKGRLDDEVLAVMDRTRWLRENAPNKPAHLGEFGLADDKWAITEEMKRSPELADLHNALWASALSGASGTALFWWWERLDQRDFYSHYRPLSQFVASIPWTGGKLNPADVSSPESRLRTLGLESGDRAWLWVFNREASWGNLVSKGRVPTEITAAAIEVRKLPAAEYQIKWWDTVKGTVVREDTESSREGVLQLHAPAFKRDLACAISRK